MDRRILSILNYLDLPAIPEWESTTGIAILTTAVNWAAKVISPDFYDLKEILLRFMVEKNYPIQIGQYDPDLGQGVVYIETAYGQFSYHFFDDIIPGEYHCPWVEWKGVSHQPWIYYYIIDFLADNGILLSEYSDNEFLRGLIPIPF